MNAFETIAELRDEDGLVVAVITGKKRKNGTMLYSYTFMREFDNNGKMQRTSWMNERHSEAVMRLTPRVVEALRALPAL